MAGQTDVKASDKDQESADKTITPQAEEQLSEEDQKLKKELYMCIERLEEGDTDVYMLAVEAMSKMIRDATCSMTSVPKPLKFLRPRLDDLIKIYEKIPTELGAKSLFAEIISVVATTVGCKGTSLEYRFLSGNNDVAKWGHEYVRHLSAEVSTIAQNVLLEIVDPKIDETIALAKVVVPYFLAHNSETEAVDLLGDLEKLELLEDYCDQDNYRRVGAYMLSCHDYLSTDDEECLFLRCAFNLYYKFEDYPRALITALKLRHTLFISELMMDENVDRCTRLQMCYFLIHCGWRPGREVETQWSLEADDQEFHDKMMTAMNNTNMSANFHALGRDLDVLDPRTPDEVYKKHLIENSRNNFGSSSDINAPMYRHRKILADAIVNAFVNTGFGTDKFAITPASGKSWISGLKESGLFAAIASLGMIHLWDVEGGLSAMDPYMFSKDDNITAGALLGCGVINANVESDCDPTIALTHDYISGDKQGMPVTMGALLGLAITYCGTGRQDVIAIFMSSLESFNNTDANVMAVLGAGLVGMGQCDDCADTITALLNWMMSQSETIQLDTRMRWAATGIAMFYFQKRQETDKILESIKLLHPALKRMLSCLIQGISNAGNGDMFVIQHLMQCGYLLSTANTEMSSPDTDSPLLDESHPVRIEKDECSQATTLIGIATLAMAAVAVGEDVGVDMCYRLFCQLLHIGNVNAKRTYPLAIALLSISDPKLNFIDTLLKFAHDNDSTTALNSVMAMGLIGAGTNNARIASMLRQLTVFHAKDSLMLVAINFAQGLIHMAKGLVTLNAHKSDRYIINGNAFAGVFCLLVSLMEPKYTIAHAPYHLMFLSLAARPRYVTTIDVDTMKHVSVPVRVGQAVDVVGQVGNPKTITGFQTHTTPVLVNYGDRVELVTGGEDEYTTFMPVLEGVVLVKKKPSETTATNGSGSKS